MPRTVRVRGLRAKTNQVISGAVCRDVIESVLQVIHCPSSRLVGSKEQFTPQVPESYVRLHDLTCRILARDLPFRAEISPLRGSAAEGHCDLRSRTLHGVHRGLRFNCSENKPSGTDPQQRRILLDCFAKLRFIVGDKNDHMPSGQGSQFPNGMIRLVRPFAAQVRLETEARSHAKPNLRELLSVVRCSSAPPAHMRPHHPAKQSATVPNPAG